MPLEPRPHQPDPNYLLRLRNQAMARMSEEEDATAPPPAQPIPEKVTRRWSIQRLAMLAAGITPAAGILMRAQTAFAAPSLRAAAPQYGAPGLSGNPPLIAPKAFTPRAELGLETSWHSSRALLLTESRGSYIFNGSQPAMVTYVQLPSGEPLGLIAVADPRSQQTYIANANALFHAWTGTDLVGIRFGYAELIVAPSIYRQPTTPGADPALIARFAAEVDDRTLARLVAPTREAHIALTKGVPDNFWGPSPQVNSKPSYPYLMNASVNDNGILEFACDGPGGSHYGTFKVDLKAKKMLVYKGS